MSTAYFQLQWQKLLLEWLPDPVTLAGSKISEQNIVAFATSCLHGHAEQKLNTCANFDGSRILTDENAFNHCLATAARVLG